MGMAENRRYNVSLWHESKVMRTARLGFALGVSLPRCRLGVEVRFVIQEMAYGCKALGVGAARKVLAEQPRRLRFMNLHT